MVHANALFFKDLVGKSLLCYISSAWTYLLYSQYRIESRIWSKWLLIHEDWWWRLRVGKVPKLRTIKDMGLNEFWPFKWKQWVSEMWFWQRPCHALPSLSQCAGKPLKTPVHWAHSWPCGQCHVDFKLEGVFEGTTNLHNCASYFWSIAWTF